MTNYIVDLWAGNKVDDYKKLASEILGAILRVQYGSNGPDTLYQTHVQGCKENGILFGSYAYFRGGSVPDAEQEAEDCKNRVDKDTRFIMVDVEQVTTHNPDDLLPAVQRFIDVCRAAGYTVGWYSYESFVKEHGLEQLQADLRWIARYPGNDIGQPTGEKPSVKSDLWQFSEHGHLDGVEGDVDLNLALDDMILAFYQGGQVQPQQVETTQANMSDPGIQFGALGVVRVTVGSLNLRKGPGTNYDVIRTLSGNETYLYYGSQDGWDNLGGGWACADYLEYKPGTAVVTADSLNVRTGPGTDNSVCGMAHNGDTFPVWGVWKDWVNVGDMDGHQRWANGKYITITA